MADFEVVVGVELGLSPQESLPWSPPFMTKEVRRECRQLQRRGECDEGN